MDQKNVTREFDRQIDNLLKKYPVVASIVEKDFFKKIEVLRNKLERLPLTEIDLEKGKLPFVLVVKNQLMTSEEMMNLAVKDGNNGVTILRPITSQNFKTIAEVFIPEEMIYLLVDIDRGKENINLPPNEALVLIMKEERSPLTIDEGIAVVTHFPEFLVKNNCFSLLASRTGKDQRVPAIWINARKQPNLGWCWDGNPHTWLGSASCSTRI